MLKEPLLPHRKTTSTTGLHGQEGAETKDDVMSTTDTDVAYDRYLSRGPGPRDRHHEDSTHVMSSVRRWIEQHGGHWQRIHPQEVWAGRTPIGPCVRIRAQAARTPVESSLERMLRRAERNPVLMGVPVAIALPDLPRLRQAVAAVVAQAPELPVTWLFVGDLGHVAVVPPPQHEAEATGPETDDQISTRSGLTA